MISEKNFFPTKQWKRNQLFLPSEEKLLSSDPGEAAYSQGSTVTDAPGSRSGGHTSAE